MSTPGSARLSFTYRFTRRDGLRQIFATGPLSTFVALVLVLDGVVIWVHPNHYIRFILPAAAILWAVELGYELRHRSIGGYALGEHTITVDGDALTHTSPTRTVSNPWEAFEEPLRQLGVLAVPLRREPRLGDGTKVRAGSAVVVPRWLLSPEDDAKLTAFLAAFLPGQETKPGSRPQLGDDPA